jgi:hypothetical protein
LEFPDGRRPSRICDYLLECWPAICGNAFRVGFYCWRHSRDAFSQLTGPAPRFRTLCIRPAGRGEVMRTLVFFAICCSCMGSKQFGHTWTTNLSNPLQCCLLPWVERTGRSSTKACGPQIQRNRALRDGRRRNTKYGNAGLSYSTSNGRHRSCRGLRDDHESQSFRCEHRQRCHSLDADSV